MKKKRNAGNIQLLSRKNVCVLNCWREGADDKEVDHYNRNKVAKGGNKEKRSELSKCSTLKYNK